MKNYETYIVIKATLTKEQIDDRISKIKDQIVSLGGEIILFEDLGVRSLAYAVEKNKRGYIIVTYHKSKPESIKELERIYKITEDVIKYMTVKYESKKEITAFDALVSKSAIVDFVAPKPREPREYNNNREGGYQRREGGYQRRSENGEGGYQRRSENGEGGYQRRSENGEGGYQRREGGYYKKTEGNTTTAPISSETKPVAPKVTTENNSSVE